jgi:hypothetical protein
MFASYISYQECSKQCDDLSILIFNFAVACFTTGLVSFIRNPQISTPPKSETFARGQEHNSVQMQM